MNKVIFYISITLSTIMVVLQALFFSIEKAYSLSFIANTNMAIVLTLSLFGLVTYCLGTDKKMFVQIKKSYLATIYICFLLVLICLSFFITINTKSLDWDAVALYDARAQFMIQGYSFSQMSNLSQYDMKNSYYYLLYPPFTSVLHWMFYQFTHYSQILVVYSIQFVILLVALFAFTSKRIGSTYSLLLCALVAGQNEVFSTSITAYTNFPYTLYLTVGIFLLYDFLIESKKWQYLLGVLLVSTSQWIRFLEPNWFGIVIAFAFTLYKVKGLKRALVLSSIFMVVCLIQYLSWKYFFSYIGHVDKIFTYSTIFILEPLLGFFTGSFLIIAMAYLRMWGNTLLLLIAPFIPFQILDSDDNYKSVNIFFKLILVMSFIIYLGGLYFISFQVSWWQEMGGSLVRSTTFLLPISLYLVLYRLRQVVTDFRKKLV